MRRSTGAGSSSSRRAPRGRSARCEQPAAGAPSPSRASGRCADTTSRNTPTSRCRSRTSLPACPTTTRPGSIVERSRSPGASPDAGSCSGSVASRGCFASSSTHSRSGSRRTLEPPPSSTSPMSSAGEARTSSSSCSPSGLTRATSRIRITGGTAASRGRCTSARIGSRTSSLTPTSPPTTATASSPSKPLPTSRSSPHCSTSAAARSTPVRSRSRASN